MFTLRKGGIFLFISLLLPCFAAVAHPSTSLALAESAPPPASQSQDAEPGAILLRLTGDPHSFKLTFSADAPVESIAEDYQKIPGVQYAEPDYYVHATAIDANDPYYSEQWYLRQVSIPTAWEKTTGSSDVVIAVLDSGIDINHPDLRDNIWANAGEIPGDGIDNDNNGYTDDVHGWDFVDWSNDPRPSAVPPYSRTALHHGTVVAGIIGASGNNQQGIAGINWRVRIMPLRVLDREGRGDVESVAQAVEYATRNGARIINMSFVGTGFSQRLYDALRNAYQAGVLIVAAAGNVSESVTGTGDLDRAFLYPVCYDAADTTGENWILGVTATDTLDQRASFANYGSRCVDLAAPGSSFASTQVYDPAQGFNEPYGGSWSGTSLSAPVVSGIAGLLLADQPNLTNKQLTSRLINTADNINSLNRNYVGKIGRGRVNAARALRNESTTPSPVSLSIDTGQVVTLPIGFRSSAVQVLSSAGTQDRSWNVPSDFAVGGSVAVSESARAAPADNKVKLSTVLRGEQQVAVTEGSGGKGRLRMYDISGTLLTEWYAFDRPFGGGVVVATGDVTGNGEGSVVVMAESKGGPQVRIFTREGKLISQFFAFDKNLRSGYSLAVGDLDSDGRAEIIATSASQNLPVRVFRWDGTLVSQWQPIPGLAGGIHVAAGDVDGDGRAEIVAGATAFGAPEVVILNGQGVIQGRFLAFAQTFRGGVNVGLGDVNSDGSDEIVVAPASGGGPQVRLFDGQARLLGQFFAYRSTFRGGVAVAVLR